MAASLFRSAVAAACWVAVASSAASVVPGEGDECSFIHQTRVFRACSGGQPQSFSHFVARHDRAYLPGSEEYAQREALFETRAAAVRSQNCDSGRRWTAGINKLSDRTREELTALRGYNRHKRPSSTEAGDASPGGGSSPLAFIQFGAQKELGRQELNWDGFFTRREVKIPRDVNWADKLSALREVPNQLACGSCWAVAATTMLRSQSEIHVQRRNFSVQELVSCVPNPAHCGGSGGCEGATIELAVDYVLKHGAHTEEDFPYTGFPLSCPHEADLNALPPKHGAWRGMSAAQRAIQSMVQRASVKNPGEAFGLTGWMRLPENKLDAVMHALVVHGPLGVSIAVESDLEMYEGGILDACQGAIVNHAVVLVGYGVGPTQTPDASGDASGSPIAKYWRLQNSWGPDFGEHGYWRLLRHDDAEEEAHCYWDEQPESGDGCTGGPKRVWVCGSCGILSNTVSAKWAGEPEDKWNKHLGSA